MLTPELASIILLGVSVLLLIVIPLLDGSERFSKYISLRYILVAVSLIMALGCILDFSHLSESSRNIVLMGGLILVGVFVAVRSLEKLKLGGKTIELSIEKGNTKVSTTLHGETTPFVNSKSDEIIEDATTEDERGEEE
jgi:protein-S-isoprenylcysteine O-methyltransferase Ste14